MHNKIYDRIKQFIVDSYKFIIFLLILFFLLTYEFPYYIDTPGGLINLEDKIEIDEKFDSVGTINLTYVLELKATLPNLILSKFNKMLLEEANDNAVIVAYRKANKEIKVVDNDLYITYLDSDAKTDLEVGDEIIEADGQKLTDKQQLLTIISQHKIGDTINFKVRNQNQYNNKKATLKDGDGRPIIGVVITEDKTLESEPRVNFNFSSNESGPSGGLMATLYIYNTLIADDITKGLTLVGTGAIDENGNVGEIGGVEFKLKGAVKKKADIFFVPNGDNYKEAIKLKDEFSYDIDIIGVDTFDQVLEYLAYK